MSFFLFFIRFGYSRLFAFAENRPLNIPNDSKHADIIHSWKVLVAKASPGEDTLPHAVISTPIVSEPGSLCTDSHLLVRVVNSEEEAKNLAKYMKTRFFRFMMIMAKNNQNMSKDVFRYVPLVDLSREWTDLQLYNLFGITKEERLYIETLIREPRR